MEPHHATSDQIRRHSLLRKTWGGATDASIPSECEMCVVDTQTVRVDRFRGGCRHHKHMLLYDGIHYDHCRK